MMAVVTRCSSCFNPLHCGAVVASGWFRQRGRCANCAFQSPSLRGSGRFARLGADLAEVRTGFNPLHCGAVVASVKGKETAVFPQLVSIPFIAGQWSLRFFWFLKRRNPKVSIPFIAGQWSLRFISRNSRRSFLCVSIPFIAGQWSLLSIFSF